ncbi:related to Lectin C-type domain protein [Phialocephala subalpina]|uniref:Maintenance of telomere capping protein 6 n=1 Tax=Phialocephala subalpina TaxID=576137 RepID=A0A1L7XBN1_9HELO|nr:related to Lectin C-type domain protein [Phialocephala subalpina]
MSENFSPAAGAEPQPPYTTVFLSQRDLGLRVPINYVTTPGVSFSAACFPFLRYEDDNSADCLSNLLASGFRRFEIDLYWDEGRNVWSFCPVQIPSSVPNTEPASTTTLGVGSSSIAGLTSLALTSSAVTSSGTARVSARQVTSGTDTESAATPTSTLSTTSASSLGETLPSIAVLPNTSNEPLIQIGPFVCTSTINLSTLTSQLYNYIQNTQNTLSASLVYVTINLHAAASTLAPASPAPSPSTLPTLPNYIGTQFTGNLSSYLYTPSNLRSDRANLNGSWYQVSEEYRPVSDYYFTETIENDIVVTGDGWPSESYMEFQKGRRLLLGWGHIDPQIAGYNFTADAGLIFPNGYIQDLQTDINATGEGKVTQGCFLRKSTDDLSQVNSSWAMTSDLSSFPYPTSSTSDLFPLLNLTSNETNCGISPLLNATLLNVTARDNFIPYQNYSYAAIWSWALGEPKSYNNSGVDNSSLYRCATANIDLLGRWVVADCSQKYYAACRAQGQPYNWTITTYPISYTYADQACQDGYTFAAPRTALENTYLNQAMRDSHRDNSAWVDFNSLDVNMCWTVGGPNATCPYTDTLAQEDDFRKRVILVPTVAAVIVLIITALTIFAKAVGNKKSTRRRKRRADNGFIYEGVPS